jgi:uncharacterized protein YbjT (DUF2867 family)
MHAILVGATGATGKDLLSLLLKDDEFERVDIFVRRDLDLRHKKLKVHIIDFEKPEQWKHLVKGDVLFSCLGTTRKAAGSKELQWKIDYDYQFQFAKIAKENNVNSYVLVSSGYASANSIFFYSKMKGQLEKDVKALKFSKLIIFNPPILLRKNSNRRIEVVGTNVIKFLNSIGIFRSHKPLPTIILAEAMINFLKTLQSDFFSIKGRKIKNYWNSN